VRVGSLNRLSAINNGTQRSEFTYNGLNQRVQIVEKTNGVVTMTRNFIWVGSEICEARNATTNAVTRRYYPQGMVAMARTTGTRGIISPRSGN
jgi:hypothetical protein